MDAIVLVAVAGCGAVFAAQRPNVIVVITDDQGYGDLSFTGNPIVKTPQLDQFAEQSIRLTNYHVDPTCSPTRAALMTGRYSDRAGVWHTLMGRSLLRARETTMADVFEANHYATGFFGKWHLGDTYPFRPEDRGFQHVVMHGSGAIGQAADYWGNDYFNDTYYVNGKWTKFEGYCTDIWFSEARKFIQTCATKKKPFFIYLSTNAPHQPLRAPQKYLEMYLNNPGMEGHQEAIPFYGMISNIDDNFGVLRAFLKQEGLEENTILIFTTDNGSSKGSGIYNAGMKGGKGVAFEGGHRVPFFLRWPEGKLVGGAEVDQITAHLDLLPTFIDLLDLQAPSIEFDGTSLVDVLRGDKNKLRTERLWWNRSALCIRKNGATAR